MAKGTHVGGWSPGAHAGDGGLVIPGHPANRFVADLVLGAADVVVRVGTASATPDWDECSSAASDSPARLRLVGDRTVANSPDRADGHRPHRRGAVRRPAHLRANPFAEGTFVDPRHARDVIRRLYIGVEPWPFGALV